MSPEAADIVSAPEQIRFRPSKKRKTYRQRAATADDHEDEDGAAAADQEENQPRAVAADYFGGGGDDEEEEEPAAIVRARRSAHRARLRGGVGFRAGSRASDTEPSGSHYHHHHHHHALVLRDNHQQDGQVAVAGITDRFTHQTGLLNDLDDRHMNEYIESRLSSRVAAQHGESSSTQQGGGATATTSTTGPTGDGGGVARNQPFIRGKVMEVDIPAVDAARPSQPQNASSSRGGVAQSSNGAASREGTTPQKQRLGPDGKPWRSRKRRNSDDIKRDKLVEEFLHENRLDVYDVPDPEPAAADAQGAGDGDADERLAEEFRRQFMEDVAARRQRKRLQKQQQPKQQPGKPGTGEVLKGPKLGGSRNSRAAVRNALLQKAKDDKK